METHSNILSGKIPWTEEPGGLESRDHKESDTTEGLSTQHILFSEEHTTWRTVGRLRVFKRTYGI